MKLSKTQIDVLTLMQEGWELGSSRDECWLQKDGLGRGGEVKRVRYATVNVLWERGLIRYTPSFPAAKWVLTKQGEEADNESSNPDVPVVGTTKPS